MRRRSLLAIAGTSFTLGIAGCVADEEGPGDEDTGEPGDGGGGEEDNGSDTGGETDGDDGSDDKDADEVLEDEDQESAVGGLEILEHEIVEDDMLPTIEGVVANNTGGSLDYVEVGVVLYNGEDQRINDSFTNTTDLPDGEEWAFEVMLTEDVADIDHYTIAVTDSPF